MSFERSTGRRPRLWTTLAALGLAGSLLASGSPAAHAFADPKDPTPTENYVPLSGYTPGPRAGGPLTLQSGALLGVHTDDVNNPIAYKDPATGKTAKRPPTVQDEPIYQLEQKLGRTLDLDNHYVSDFSGFYNSTTGANVPLPPAVMLDADANRIPIVGWACAPNADVLAGKLDKQIDAAAAAFKGFSDQFFMRYCWEMDGSRQPATVNGDPGQFIAAWRYIYNRVKNVDGASNVIWLWTANANGFKLGGWPAVASKYYPGDAYVDWVSSDGYNWHGAIGRSGQDRYRQFLEIYDQFMKWARTDDPDHQHVGSAKPIMVAEYGTQEQEDGGALKADWFRIAHDTVMPRTASTPGDCKYCGAMSDIQAMVYFDIAGKSGDSSGGWNIETSQPSFDAYREAAQTPWFNHIADLTWGPYSGGGTDPGTTPTTQPTTTPTTTPTAPPGAVKASGRTGYWMLGSDGKVYAFGQAKNLGTPTLVPGAVAADLEATPSGDGYWIVDSLGHVYAYGDAASLGGIDAGRLAPGETVTSLSGTPSGKGYWIFTSRGRAVSVGDAVFYGDMSKVALAGPVLDSIPTPTGLGYYMVGSDGGIFAFGDAKFHGSMGGQKLNAPVQSLVPDTDGAGYWLVASDGGIFAFGNARFNGSMGGTKLAKPVTGMVPYGNGYMMVAEDGGIFNFSDKPFEGSLGASPPSRPIVSVAALA
jgi:Glycosyl hydrolase family 26